MVVLVRDTEVYYKKALKVFKGIKIRVFRKRSNSIGQFKLNRTTSVKIVIE